MSFIAYILPDVICRVNAKKENTSMNIGSKLKNIREENNLKQTDLAKVLNVSTRQVQRYEANHSIPSIQKLQLLSEYFSVSIDYFTKQ